MERKIGEIFKYEGKKLRVEADNDSECKRCYLNELCPNINKEIIGECVRIHRQDKTSVVFVEVKDEQPQEQAEQTRELNLCEILKDCPKGTKLYSPAFGEETYFVGITSCQDDVKPIIIRVGYEEGDIYCLSSNGHLYADDYGECCIFPSKEMRDWSKFTAPWYKKEESIKPKFKVGDIIRHKETNKDDVYEISKVYDDSYVIAGFPWMICMEYQDQYELVPNKFDPKTLKAFDRVIVWDEINAEWFCANYSHRKKTNIFIAATTCGNYLRCIPYNDDTKHLVGTTDEAPVFYRYWED